MGLIKKIWDMRWVFRNLPQSIFFNFYYLPFRQAVKLPIVLYKPNFQKLGGKIILDVEKVRPMMVRWGHEVVSIYPNSGINISILGEIVIKGPNSIGNNSYLSIGPKGNLVFNGRFSATTTLKLVCFNSVVFGNHVTVGWDVLFMDTDFHKMTKLDGSKTQGIGSITIGDYNWFGCKCLVMKNTKTNPYTTISAGTTLTGNYLNFPEKSVIGTSKEICVLREGVFLDPYNDR